MMLVWDMKLSEVESLVIYVSLYTVLFKKKKKSLFSNAKGRNTSIYYKQLVLE